MKKMQSTMKTLDKQWWKIEKAEKTVLKNPKGFLKISRSFYLLMLRKLKVNLNKKLLIFRFCKLPPKLSENFMNFINLYIRKFTNFIKFYKTFLSLGLKSSISPNIRKTFLWQKISKFLFLQLESSITRNIRKTFSWKKYKKDFSFFEKKYKKFLCLKCKKNFFLGKIKEIFQSKFFSFFELGLKSDLGRTIYISLIYIY